MIGSWLLLLYNAFPLKKTMGKNTIFKQIKEPYDVLCKVRATPSN